MSALHDLMGSIIIGGIVLQVKYRIIDGSVRAQLDAMRKQLLVAGN